MSSQTEPDTALEILRTEALARIARSASHEFGNLFAAMLLSAEQIARMPTLDPAARRRTEVIIDAVHRAQQVTNVIQAIATPPAPRTLSEALHAAVADLRAFLSRAVAVDADIHLSPAVPAPSDFNILIVALACALTDAIGQHGMLRIVAEERGPRSAIAMEVARTRLGAVVDHRGSLDRCLRAAADHVARSGWSVTRAPGDHVRVVLLSPE